MSAFSIDEVFVLRTPLLPVDVYLAWLDAGRRADVGHDDGDSFAWRRFDQFFSIPDVQDALYASSPQVLTLAKRTATACPLRPPHQLLRALAGYLTRMATRPTPFGLCAGYSIGSFGSQAALTLCSRHAYRVHSEVDYASVSLAADRLLSQSSSASLLVRDPSLFKVGGRWRFVRRHVDAKGSPVRRISEVRSSPALDALFEVTRSPRTKADILAALVDATTARPEREWDAWLSTVIDSGALRSTLGPSLTDSNMMAETVTRIIGTGPAPPVAAVLMSTSATLASADAARSGTRSAAYTRVCETVESISGQAARLNFVLSKPALGVTLPPAVRDAVRQAVTVLHRVSDPLPESDIVAFAERFTDRYGDEELPLLQALDEDYGLGFQADRAPSSDARQFGGRLLLPPVAPEGKRSWTAQDAHRLTLLAGALSRGQRELDLVDADLSSLEVEGQRPLPESFHLRATLAAPSAEHVNSGLFRLLLRECSGPPGARLIARFCHQDPPLRQHVEALSAQDAALHADSLFAEVLHEVDHDGVNVLRRGFATSAVIALSARHAALSDRIVLLPDDLFVSVRRGTVTLRSGRLNKRVIPRFTNALMHSRRSSCLC